MSDRTETGDTNKSWRNCPTPPSSGGGDVTIPSSKKRDLAHTTAEHEDSTQHTKRRCRTSKPYTGILTPPSTRGRRMVDRLGSQINKNAHAPSQRDTLPSRWGEEAPDTPTVSRNENKRTHALSADVYPIRDTPHNPFIEGGPADIGMTGPNGAQASRRAAAMPYHSAAKAVYVFRGQRVRRTDQDSARASEVSGTSSPIKPRLLFPPRKRTACANRSGIAPPSRSYNSPSLELVTLGKGKACESALPVPDTEAAWLAGSVPVLPRPQRQRPALPRTNLELLAKLEDVDWSTDEDSQCD
ncbi:hypothetical protein MVES_003144 [Malassezia vespertilionis]|uniref:Uncharacterized protein n=1 Tax=Malassezia vespertilionis TaxID=2020962 RepID=A0A2N1J8S5_9BASI|nr:hypothetical protein MVES_003144 [Malassezia vespertilionis]